MADETTLAEAPGGDEIVNHDEVVTEVQTGDGTAAEEPEPEGAEEPAPEGEEEKPKKLSGSRRERIRNELLRQENAELNRRLEEAGRSGAGKEATEKEPQEADFNGDYFAYERARTEFAVRQAVRDEMGQRDSAKRAVEQSDVWRERVAAHKERVEEAKEAITDFDKVLASSTVPVSNEVSREILTSDKSALISYYLAKNPEKLQALNGMTGRELAREIGRLEGSVRMPASIRKTNAPAPITALRGGAAPAFDPSASSMDDYIAKRSAGWSG